MGVIKGLIVVVAHTLSPRGRRGGNPHHFRPKGRSGGRESL